MAGRNKGNALASDNIGMFAHPFELLLGGDGGNRLLHPSRYRPLPLLQRHRHPPLPFIN